MNLLQIVAHTPRWVFVLFAVLVGYGATQLFARSVGFGRVFGVAAGMAIFGLFGVASAFAAAVPAALPAALLAGALTAAFVAALPVPAGTSYDAAERRFRVPGSAVPLGLMLAIFATKYAVGVALALHPEMRNELPFALGIAGLYGLFSGAFLGRSLRLVALARRAPPALQAA